MSIPLYLRVGVTNRPVLCLWDNVPTNLIGRIQHKLAICNQCMVVVLCNFPAAHVMTKRQNLQIAYTLLSLPSKFQVHCMLPFCNKHLNVKYFWTVYNWTVNFWGFGHGHPSRKYKASLKCTGPCWYNRTSVVVGYWDTAVFGRWRSEVKGSGRILQCLNGRACCFLFPVGGGGAVDYWWCPNISGLL